jgi:hypothetical protein
VRHALAEHLRCGDVLVLDTKGAGPGETAAQQQSSALFPTNRNRLIAFGTGSANWEDRSPRRALVSNPLEMKARSLTTRNKHGYYHHSYNSRQHNRTAYGTFPI